MYLIEIKKGTQSIYFTMKLIYCLLLIFCGSVFTSAQKTYTVQGTVQDFHDKTMLENAVVKIGNLTAKTDKRGVFSFNKVPAGSIHSLQNILIAMIILKI